MELAVNNIRLLSDFVRRGILTSSCEFNYVVSSGAVDSSSVMDKIILKSFMSTGKIRIEYIGDITYSDIYYYTRTYGLNRYVYYEFHSIDIAKKQSLRLVTDNSAMKQLAQAENVKILTVKQMEEIIVRNIKYEEVIKIKKSGNL